MYYIMKNTVVFDGRNKIPENEILTLAEHVERETVNTLARDRWLKKKLYMNLKNIYDEIRKIHSKMEKSSKNNDLRIRNVSHKQRHVLDDIARLKDMQAKHHDALRALPDYGNKIRDLQKVRDETRDTIDKIKRYLILSNTQMKVFNTRLQTVERKDQDLLNIKDTLIKMNDELKGTKLDKITASLNELSTKLSTTVKSSEDNADRIIGHMDANALSDITTKINNISNTFLENLSASRAYTENIIKALDELEDKTELVQAKASEIKGQTGTLGNITSLANTISNTQSSIQAQLSKIHPSANVFVGPTTQTPPGDTTGTPGTAYIPISTGTNITPAATTPTTEAVQFFEQFSNKMSDSNKHVDLLSNKNLRETFTSVHLLPNNVIKDIVKILNKNNE